MRLNINIISAKFAKIAPSTPLRFFVLCGLLISIAAVVLALWPQTVTFSYAGKTCFFQPTIGPSLLQSRAEGVRLESSKRLVVGGVTLAALDMCVVPTSAPKTGTYHALLTPVGIPFPQKAYAVVVPERPTVSLQSVDGPIPITQDLRISLSQPDRVFSYVLRFDDDSSVLCSLEDRFLECSLAELNLSQGKKYTMTLERHHDGQKVDVVAQKTITTLKSAKVVKTSIKKGQVVYAKPKMMDIWFDKELASAKAVLTRKDGKGKGVTITVKVAKKKVQILWKEHLDRRTSYQLTLQEVTANDGSMLEGEYKLHFKMSGGPQVTGINIGTYNVPSGSTAAITFDQALENTSEITRHITVTGGAKVVGYEGSQVYVSFAGVGRCQEVKIAVDDSVKSRYGVSGDSAWQYLTRTTCQTVRTIGTSSQGRALNAYIFGNGSRTIMYTGAIHGDEASTYYLMLRWVEALEAQYNKIPKGVRIIVVPSINPDGIALGVRTNARDVDLNRNFNTSDWKKDVTDVNGRPFPGGGGTGPLSEPESKAIAQFVSQTAPSLIVSYHSIGAVVLANPISGARSYAQTYANRSGYAYSSSSAGTFDYSISGTADDYYAEKVGVASIVVELGSHTYHQFEQNQAAMWAMMQ